jgi:hypothetical protein
MAQIRRASKVNPIRAKNVRSILWKQLANVGAMSSRFRFPLISLVLGLCVFAEGSCGTMKKLHLLPQQTSKPESKAPAPTPRRVGTVTLVNDADQFVLIDTATAPAPEAGTALKTFTGEVESGVVTVGSVSRRPFVVADIVSGAPRKGDAVFE